MNDIDDKTLVIVAVTILALFSMFTLNAPENVITNVISGLFGVAVGKSLVTETKL